jgi:hypothetical protein
MTYQEIVKRARQLPSNERWLVVNELLHSLQTEIIKSVTPDQAATSTDDEFSAAHMRGILKPTGPIPTDEEVKQDYINYLSEKYS